jgi:hypothetical protein
MAAKMLDISGNAVFSSEHDHQGCWNTLYNLSIYLAEKPKFIKQPDDILVTENEDVQFECKASGDPAPVIVWRKENGQIPVNRLVCKDFRSKNISRSGSKSIFSRGIIFMGPKIRQ